MESCEKIEHIHLVLRALRKISRLMVNEKDRDRLIQGICHQLVENHCYYGAWIALMDKSGGLGRTAEAGLGEAFFPMIERLRYREMIPCAQKALSGPEIVLTHNPMSLCAGCPLSECYAGKGAWTVRLEHEGEVYGILCVAVPGELLWDEEEQALVGEVAGEIAFGLHRLDLEEDLYLAGKTAQQTANTLADRVRELDCLYAISRLGQRRRLSLDRILQGIVDLIPQALRHSEIACARIFLDAKEFRTDNFKETIWNQTNDIIVHGGSKGRLEVCYLEEVPEWDEGFFQREARSLIEAIAERVGKIGERKQAEEMLQRSEQRFRDLIENSLTGISIVQNNRVVYQNQEQEKLLGPLPRAFKLIDYDSIHPSDVERVKGFYQKITSGEVTALDTEFRFYPGTRVGGRADMKWVYCRASRIEFQKREAILINMMDVTKAMEMEHLLRIQDKMTSLGRVAAGIAHEIRNPLSGINIYLNALQRIYEKGGSSEKIRDILEQLLSASNKIESIIKRVMDFSRPTAPKLVLTDLNTPIEEAIELSSVTLRKRGVKIEKTLAGDLPLCLADPHMIEQVVLNLVTNAAEAMKNIEGTKRIRVASSLDNDRIIVKVSDSGSGVPSDQRDEIFDPFYTTKSGSTGIGLSIAHRIVADHGGSLDVFESKWGGAEFTISIPLTERAQDK